MKVRVSFTVEIDPAAWTSNYGVEGAAAIRDDVKVYCEAAALDQLERVEVLVEED
jgi:hypothetical protein